MWDLAKLLGMTVYFLWNSIRPYNEEEFTLHAMIKGTEKALNVNILPKYNIWCLRGYFTKLGTNYEIIGIPSRSDEVS